MKSCEYWIVSNRWSSRYSSIVQRLIQRISQRIVQRKYQRLVQRIAQRYLGLNILIRLHLLVVSELIKVHRTWGGGVIGWWHDRLVGVVE